MTESAMALESRLEYEITPSLAPCTTNRPCTIYCSRVFCNTGKFQLKLRQVVFVGH